MKIGFDNEKYLSEQSEEIRRRAAKYGKLYLEFGGKLMNDFHAARCLPGYDPNVKLRLLQSLKDQAEIILCIYAGDIEHKKMRADFGISYADDALKLIDDLKRLGLLFRGVVITRYTGQVAAQQFRQRLENRGIKVFFHYVTQGYPADVETLRQERIRSHRTPHRGRHRAGARLRQVRHLPLADLPRVPPREEGRLLEVRDLPRVEHAARASAQRRLRGRHDRPQGLQHDRPVPPPGVRQDDGELQPRRGRLPAPARHLGEDDGQGMPLQVAHGHGREPHRLRHHRRRRGARGVEAGGHPPRLPLHDGLRPRHDRPRLRGPRRRAHAEARPQARGPHPRGGGPPGGAEREGGRQGQGGRRDRLRRRHPAEGRGATRTKCTPPPR